LIPRVKGKPIGEVNGEKRIVNPPFRKLFFRDTQYFPDGETDQIEANPTSLHNLKVSSLVFLLAVLVIVVVIRKKPGPSVRYLIRTNTSCVLQ